MSMPKIKVNMREPVTLTAELSYLEYEVNIMLLC